MLHIFKTVYSTATSDWSVIVTGRYRVYLFPVTSFGTADAILLSTLTSISPDVPLLVLVKATFFAQRPDVFGDATFIVAGFLHQQVPLNCHDRLLAYP